MAPNRGFWGHSQDGSIYDQLISEERRSAARAAGRRVGDLLEAQALEAALAASRPQQAEARPETPTTLQESESGDSSDEEALIPLFEDAQTTLACDDVDDDASLLLQMPAELAVRVLGYCSIEGAFRGAAACKTWYRRSTSEILCEVLCRRHWRTCRPQRWGGFRQMLARRDRVRLSGFYALRQSRSKPVRRDMWTPKELDQVYWVEAAWWRCLRFFADGSLRYCLFAEPEGGLQAVARLAAKRLAPEMTPRHRRDEEKTHRGAYELRRGVVDAVVEVPHGRVGFCLTLTHGARGRGVGLDLDRHSQVETGGVSFDHRVPEDQRAFTFVAVPAWA